MHRVLAGAPLLLAVACSGAHSAAEDAAIYAEILREAGQDPEDELRRCAGLADQTLAGDCAAVVAVAAGKRWGDAASWCARVPLGSWRDECVFQAAEGTFAAGASGGAALNTADAAALCQQAGAYAVDCGVHLWRPQLGLLTNGMSPAGFIERYASAEALYQQTSAQLGASPTLDSMFWLSFFGTGFHATGAVNPDACQGLPPEGVRRCQDAAAVLQTEPLEGLLRQRDQLADFCAASPPRAADVAPLLGVPPSDALDRALLAQQPMICGAGGTALSGGLRNRSAPGGGR